MGCKQGDTWSYSRAAINDDAFRLDSRQFRSPLKGPERPFDGGLAEGCFVGYGRVYFLGASDRLWDSAVGHRYKPNISIRSKVPAAIYRAIESLVAKT